MDPLAKRSLPLLLLSAIALLAAGAALGRMLANQNRSSERPVAAAGTYSLQVDDYSGGQCTFVTLTRGPETDRIVDSCHGWWANACDGALAVVSEGVRADQGVLIVARSRPSDGDNKLDLDALIATAVQRARGARYEYLHLNFESARCGSGILNVVFTGSTIERGVQGPARGMQGRILVRRGNATVQFSRI